MSYKINIKQAVSPEDILSAKQLLVDYQKYLGIDLCFQGFDDELAHLPGKYAPPRGRLYLSEVNDEPAGCIAFYEMEKDVAELKRLFVKQDFRGAGIGRMMIERAIADARRIGYKKVRLDSLARLQQASDLYRKLGFDTCEPYNQNPEEDVYYMELSL